MHRRDMTCPSSRSTRSTTRPLTGRSNQFRSWCCLRSRWFAAPVRKSIRPVGFSITISFVERDNMDHISQVENDQNAAKQSDREAKKNLALGYVRAIASLGGNLPDDRLTSRTGPNDAVSRGLMYTEARRLAIEVQKLLEQL